MGLLHGCNCNLPIYGVNKNRGCMVFFAGNDGGRYGPKTSAMASRRHFVVKKGSSTRLDPDRPLERKFISKEKPEKAGVVGAEFRRSSGNAQYTMHNGRGKE